MFTEVHLLVKISVLRLSLLRYTVAPSTWSRRTVGTVSSTCNAKFEHLITSTLLTSESMMIEVLGELSIEMALPLPLTRMVVFLHLVIKIE